MRIFSALSTHMNALDQ